nr:MAG TPA: hypothetical protein [Caudoviricetes sp.]
MRVSTYDIITIAKKKVTRGLVGQTPTGLFLCPNGGETDAKKT